MCDYLVSFNAETKSGRGGLYPFLGSRLLQQLAKGEVDFNRIQLRRVVLQEFCLGKFRGIEVGLPAWVSPSRCACIKLCHVSALPRPGIILTTLGLYLSRLFLRRRAADF